MKKLFMLIPSLLLGITLMAQPPEGPADKGMVFGAKTDLNGAIPTEKLASALSNTDAKTAEVKITGKVVEVCKAEGGGIKVESPNGPLMVKRKDHAFMVPLSLNGTNIVLEGTASLKETSVDMLRHYAEDAGKTKEEIAAITQPKKEIIIQAKGILVL